MASKAKSRIFVFLKNVSNSLAASLGKDFGFHKIMDLARHLKGPFDTWESYKTTNGYVGDRIRQKLKGSRVNNFSLASKLTLVQSIISAIPIFTMQTTMLPNGVCQEIDKKE